MHFLKLVDVSNDFIENLWKRVEKAGSYYSIGDGFSLSVFRKMIFESCLVLQGKDFVVRLEKHPDCFEIHPIVFGTSLFRDSVPASNELLMLVERLFDQRPICCIIPEGMRSAKRLAEASSFARERMLERNLSGVKLLCGVYVKRRK